MLAVLALTAAVAAPSLDLPRAFADQLPRVKDRTELRVLLPQRMRIDLADPPFTSATSGASAYRFRLEGARDCAGANVCFLATFSARAGGRPSPTGQRVRLARGRVGRFFPLSCGASCAPASVAWREHGAVYAIEAKVRRAELLRMARSAIRRGAR